MGFPLGIQVLGGLGGHHLSCLKEKGLFKAWRLGFGKPTKTCNNCTKAYPIGSMGLVYLPTFTYIYLKIQPNVGIQYTVYIAYMDPMGIGIGCFFPKGQIFKIRI